MIIPLISLILATTAYSSAWAPDNSPYKLDQDLLSKISQLPLTGKIQDPRLGWPGSHWASYLGGIAHRWSAGNPQNFTYKLLSLTDLKNLEPHELNELSPAEKFDIFQSNYSYPTVRKIFKTLSPQENEWHGICHGYAPAALNHPEPASVTLMNPDGLLIHFYSSDVAALMSYYYAKIVTTKAVLIGRRCNYNATSRIPLSSESACNDLNPGAFHLVLTNKLGLKGIGFIADIDRYFEVWNHIAVNYEMHLKGELEPSSTSAPKTLKRHHVEVVVTYAAAIAPKFGPVLGTENAQYAQQTYEYYLDVDKLGQVIGGDWISSVRPDFVWTKKKSLFSKDWKALNVIYQPAVSN